VVEVEEALDRRTPVRRPDHYFDPVSLGGLIVAAAGLAWQIYSDRRQKGVTPPAAAIAETVSNELKNTADAGSEVVDRIVAVVVSETLRGEPST
jgi:hypothetical protein